MDDLLDKVCFKHVRNNRDYFEATPGLWSVENLLRRKVTPMAKRTRKRPVVFTIWASVSFAAYCKMFNMLAVYRLHF